MIKTRDKKGDKKTGNLGDRRDWPSPKSRGMGTPDSSPCRRKDYKMKQTRMQIKEIVGIGDIEVTCWRLK